MWHRAIILFSFVISLMLLGVSNSAFADNFYQNPIVIEHTNILNITDASIPGNTITATIQSPAVNPTDTISVDLTRVSGTNNFISGFINFTSTATNDAYDKLHVVAGNTIQVNYGTPWTMNIIANNVQFPANEMSTAKTVPLLLRAYNTVCTTPVNYGGDADNDFICNNWETSTGLQINYPVGTTYTLTCTPGATYATNPLGDQVCPKTTEKDMYVEIDYMQGHKPDLNALKNVVNAFQAAPPTNKINLHVFLDEQLPHAPSTYFPGTDAQPGLLQIKSKHFGTVSEQANPSLYNAKAQVFQYFLWAHDQTGAPKTSGTSDGANDGGVTLGSFSATVAGSRKQQEGTFMHELGHNLGLNHGGPKTNADNCKPNLISVMNYAYQFGDLVPNPNLDFSRSAIGTNTAGSTSLGSENTLPNTAMDVANSSPSGLYMVYGIGNGQTSYQQLPQTIPASPSWPTPWQSIRTISDNTIPPNVVCSAPATSVALSGFNQWSLITMNHGSGSWLQGRSLLTNDPIYISTDKLEYTFGNDIQVHGSVNPISADPVLIKVISPNESIVTVAQPTPNAVGDFDIVLIANGTWTQTGSYKIEATYQKSEPQFVYIYINNETNFDIPKDTWCISLEEAQEQIKKNTKLDIEYAPLCNTEITMDNVRAARSINVGNIIGKIESLDDDKYFTNYDSKEKLIQAAKNIRALVLDDKLDETIASYADFKTLIDTEIKDDFTKDILKNRVDISTYILNPIGEVPVIIPDLPVITELPECENTDDDGIPCKIDQCPNTPRGDRVNENGCTIPGGDPRDIVIIILIIIIIILLVILYIQNRKNTGLKKSANTDTPSFQSSK